MSPVNESSPAPSAADAPEGVNRRDFLESIGRVAALTTIAGGLSLAPSIAGVGAEAEAAETGGPKSMKKRRTLAYKHRLKVAKANLKRPVQKLTDNGDEDLYPNRIGNFHKSLPHDANGEVDPAAYLAFLNAVSKGTYEAFEAVPMGEATFSNRVVLKNPLSGLGFDLEGLDVCQYALPPSPAIASAEIAAEMVEHYWQARLRDVHFDDYGTDPAAAAAIAELNGMTDFRGPKAGGVVTPATLFRSVVPGVGVGPYISQFLLKPVPFGATYVDNKMRTVMAGDEFMKTFPEWLAIQNGSRPTSSQNFDNVRRHIRNGRDLAQWVHIDVLYQAYFQAALILLTPPDAGDLVTGGGMGGPMNPGNPYLTSQTQCGFGTFGPPYIMTLLTEVATRALKAVWFHKWFVNRKLRPEAFGGLVHRVIAGGATYPLHADVLDSSVVDLMFTDNGSYLLPQVFPEGSPSHPSYGSGHATVAGACVTILKALFDENHVVPNPVVASPDGLSLLPYGGGDAGQMTVGVELNKLASNVAEGRNIAGVHWRSDAHWSLRLGEQVAIAVLRDQANLCAENFDGYTFTTFDGETVTV